MLKLNKEDLKSLKELFYEKEDNIFLSSTLNEYLEDHESLKESIDEDNKNESFEMALLDYVGLDLDDKFTLKKIDEYELNKIEMSDLSLVLNNPYYKNVTPEEYKDKSLHLYYKKYEPYEGFLSDEITLKTYFKEINHLSFFDTTVPFLSLDKDDVTRMSITPHEINTMEKDIVLAKGKVLVLGLGLGYFTYMISLKEEVSQIVVIEKDKTIIELFKTKIFPYFKNKDKIKIVEEDAFKAVKNTDGYDFIYVDIYHDAVEALPLYIRFKKEEKEKEFNYWIETSILCYFRRFVLTVFLEETMGIDPKVYEEKATNFDDKLINSLYFYLKDIEFNSFNQIVEFLKEESLKKVIKNLNFK